MRYLGADEGAEMSGIGYLGEVAQGPDGRLYQYVETVDGLGNPIGIWKRLRKIGQRAISRALPIAQRLAPFVPGVGPAAALAISRATPYLRQAGLVGVDGLGALYQAPDGALYRMDGMGQDDVLQGYLAEDELQGFNADDELQGFAAEDELQGFAAEDELDGLGADDELDGLDADDELSGFAQDPELQGVAQPDDLQGIDEGEDMAGVSADDELSGFAQDPELQGLEQGYVRQPGMSAYVPPQAPATRWFVDPAQPPSLWKPLW
jgi:hypothetical protein